MGRNYNKQYVKKTVADEVTPIEDVVTDEVTEVDTPTTEVSEKTVVTGTVVNCNKLNIRKAADKRSSVVCVVDKGAKLTIDTNLNNKKWLRVTTGKGEKGYCMAEFVSYNN